MYMYIHTIHQKILIIIDWPVRSSSLDLLWMLSGGRVLVVLGDDGLVGPGASPVLESGSLLSGFFVAQCSVGRR